MSKQELIQFSDDFTGEISADVKRYSFGWMGNYYEIDLNAPNAEAVSTYMQSLIAVASPIKKQRRYFDDEKKKKEDLRPIREWLQSQGYPVSNRGQIKKRHLEAYREAHS